MRFLNLSILVMVCVLTVGMARGSSAVQQTRSDTSSHAEASSPATEAQIREYFGLTGMEAVTRANLSAQVDEARANSAPFVPPAIWDEIKIELQKIDIVSLVIPIYQRHFTETDMRDALVFYRTPIGRKFLQANPLITNEAGTILSEKTSMITQAVYQKHHRDLEEAEKR